MPSPKTATLRLEIVNDDGSKTIVTTADLDASRLPARGAHDDAPERIVIGMVDPYYDPEDYSQRRNRWVHDTLAVGLPLETHFNLNFQLPPVNSHKPVYTIQEVEAPATNIVMIFNSGKPVICPFDETVAAEKAERFGTHGSWDPPIYFLLDIPS